MQLEYVENNQHHYKTFTGSCLISSDFTALAIPENESIFLHSESPTSFHKYETVTYNYTDTDVNTEQLIHKTTGYMHITSITVTLSNPDTINIEPYFKILNDDTTNITVTRKFGHVQTAEANVTLRSWYVNINFISNCPAEITVTCSTAAHMF